MKILKFMFYLLALVLVLGMFSGLYIYNYKPDIGPSPDLKLERSEGRIERGSYLANSVTVCMDCHSRRNWTLFSGPILPGTEGGGGEVFGENEGFPGTIYATNLTPYRMKSWSDGDIYRAITGGVGKDGRALFPLMGYHRFGKMDREDIYSIIVYIRTLPSLSNDVPYVDLDFPVNLLNNLSPQLAVHEDIPHRVDGIKYGAYLVNAAGCVDCHSMQDKGKIVPGSEFAGGMEFVQPAGIMRAPNITPHPEKGIGNWTEDLFIQKFKIYGDSGFTIPAIAKNELNSPMPWSMYAGMTNSDLKAIFAYLKSLPPQDVSVQIRQLSK